MRVIGHPEGGKQQLEQRLVQRTTEHEPHEWPETLEKHTLTPLAALW